MPPLSRSDPPVKAAGSSQVRWTPCARDWLIKLRLKDKGRVGGDDRWHRAITRSTTAGSATRKRSGPTAAAEIDWFKPWDKVFDPDARRLWPLVRRRASATPASTASTATPPSGRADQTAHHLRQPGHRHEAAHQLRASCCDEVQALAAVLTDLGVEKGDRVIIYMPMVPEAVVRHARLRAARRRAFRRLRRLRRAGARHPHRRRQAEARSSPPPAASSPAASSPTSRCSTRRSSCATHKPERCLILQREQQPAS